MMILLVVLPEMPIFVPLMCETIPCSGKPWLTLRPSYTATGAAVANAAARAVASLVRGIRCCGVGCGPVEAGMEAGPEDEVLVVDRDETASTYVGGLVSLPSRAAGTSAIFHNHHGSRNATVGCEHV